MELSREEWLQDAAELILIDLIGPTAEIPESLKIKCSVGFPPNTRTNSKVIGCCLRREVSAGDYNEIFITPKIADSMLVLETLVHEVIHAVDNCEHGHTGLFKRIARAVGLAGPITATHANDTLRAELRKIINVLGPIPHSKIDLSSVPQQKNRNIKVWCECGFKFNTSRTQISKVLALHSEIQCPCCFKAMTSN